MCFEPLEFLEKLVAMIPKPRINLFLYHGVVAPHARLRPDVVRRARRASADRPGRRSPSQAHRKLPCR